MKNQKHSIAWILLAAVVSVTLGMGIPAALAEEETAATSEQRPDANEAQTAETSKTPLDGAKVFAWNCGSCHSERYPPERTDGEWEMIVMHMRVRANLTAEQAEAVLAYLQENNP